MTNSPLPRLVPDRPSDAAKVCRFCGWRGVPETAADPYTTDGTVEVCGQCNNAESMIEVPAKEHPTLTEQLQQKCSDWGAYWRAPDAHGVILSRDQALELLRDALGVEVEIAAAAPPAEAPAERGEWPQTIVVASGDMCFTADWDGEYFVTRSPIELAAAPAAPATEFVCVADGGKCGVGGYCRECNHHPDLPRVTGGREVTEDKVIELVAGPFKWHHKMDEQAEREAKAFDRCRELTILNVRTFSANVPPSRPLPAGRGDG